MGVSCLLKPITSVNSMDVFSFSYHHVQVIEYEGCFIRIFPDREAWWGEILFPNRKRLKSYPCSSFSEALNVSRLKIWEAKVESITEPAALISLHTLSVIYQNLVGIHMFGDARFQNVSDYAKSPLDFEGFLRSCEEVETNAFLDLQARTCCFPALMKGRKLLHFPEPLIIVSAERH